MVEVEFRWHIHSRSYQLPVVPRIGETVSLEDEGISGRTVEDVRYTVSGHDSVTAIVKLSDY